MDLSYLNFTGSVLLLGVFGICAAIYLSRLVLTQLEMNP
jgi:hypothetical protein